MSLSSTQEPGGPISDTFKQPHPVSHHGSRGSKNDSLALQGIGGDSETQSSEPASGPGPKRQSLPPGMCAAKDRATENNSVHIPRPVQVASMDQKLPEALGGLLWIGTVKALLARESKPFISKTCTPESRWSLKGMECLHPHGTGMEQSFGTVPVPECPAKASS